MLAPLVWHGPVSLATQSQFNSTQIDDICNYFDTLDTFLTYETIKAAKKWWFYLHLNFVIYRAENVTLRSAVCRFQRRRPFRFNSACTRNNFMTAVWCTQTYFVRGEIGVQKYILHQQTAATVIRCHIHYGCHPVLHVCGYLYCSTYENAHARKLSTCLTAACMCCMNVSQRSKNKW